MTRSDLRTLVSDWLDDPNNGYFTVADINRWLNNAQRETQKQLLQAAQNYYLVCFYTPLVTQSDGRYSTDYELPADCLKLQKLEYVQNINIVSESSSTLIYTTPMQADLNTDGGPSGYWLKKTRVSLTPRPQTAGYLRLSYAYAVADMQFDSEVPDCPVNYHEYLAVLAALDGLNKDQRDQSSMLAKKQYFEMLMKQDAIERNQDVPRHIITTSEDGPETLF